MFRFTVFALSCSLLLGTPIVWAAPPAKPANAAATTAANPTKDARSLFQSGTAHYNLAEYDEALANFKEAYRLRPDPVFLFNIGQCYRKLDDPAAAATFYRSYLRETKNPPNRAEVDRTIIEMERLAAKRPRKPAVIATPTPEVSPAPLASPAPVAKTHPAMVINKPVEAEKKPLVKKPWFWVAVVGSAAVVATAIALGVVFGAPKDPSASFGKVSVP